MKLTFMGTAGARFMVAKQLAASGGLYIEDGSTRMSLDPGPGAVVQYAKRKVDLTKLDAIVLSHRHLDHAGDVNVMVEAMTEGGFHRATHSTTIQLSFATSASSPRRSCASSLRRSTRSTVSPSRPRPSTCIRSRRSAFDSATASVGSLTPPTTTASRSSTKPK
ncbi:MAG: MBL fold metallo-hydrolase [Chloroflexi bacterium]|nr:MAG: MBL fold metallo-hydrolase [Chloroflexota bacterium]